MVDFVVNFSEPSSFDDRNKKSLKTNILISLIIFIFTLTLSNWRYGLITTAFFLIVQYFKSFRWDIFFITDILVNKEQIVICYKERNEIKKVIGSHDDIKFKKEIAFNKTRTTYLAVYFKGNLLIKQFEIGEWNEKIFDELITNSYYA